MWDVNKLTNIRFKQSINGLWLVSDGELHGCHNSGPDQGRG